MDEREIEWRTYGVTELTPLTLGFTLILIAFTLVGPRRARLAPLLIAIAILPSVQRFVIGGLDFPMVRLLMVVSWIPVLLGMRKGPFRWGGMNGIDKALIAWVLAGSVVYIIRRADAAALSFKAGMLLDAIGVYFLVRQTVWRSDQMISVLKTYAWLILVIGTAMTIEFNTGRNFFSVFGSAIEVTLVRGDEFRAVSSFSHPILAGTFGALVLAAMIGLWRCEPRYWLLAALGAVGSYQTVMSSNSSGPLIAMVFGVGCWACWSIRDHLTPIRWVVVILAVIIHFAREKPLWHLILRAGEVMGGGTGYHRFNLIDATVNNWRDWILIGTDGAAGWGWGLQDLTNQWVFEAVNGGLLTLGAFNVLLFLAFRDLGRTFRHIKSAPDLDSSKKNRLINLGWAHGIILAVFCMSFISIALFGQMNALFYVQLAVISSFTDMPEIRAALSSSEPDAMTDRASPRSTLSRREIGPSSAVDSSPVRSGASLGAALTSIAPPRPEPKPASASTQGEAHSERSVDRIDENSDSH